MYPARNGPKTPPIVGPNPIKAIILPKFFVPKNLLVNAGMHAFV